MLACLVFRRPWLWPPWQGGDLRPREVGSLAPGHTAGDGVASSSGLVSVSTLHPSACLLSRFSRVRLCSTPWAAALQLLCLWDFPGKNTGMGCQALLRGIFPTQGWKAHLLCLPALAGGVHRSHVGSPRITGRIQRAGAAASAAICRTGRVSTAAAASMCPHRRREVARRWQGQIWGTGWVAHDFLPPGPPFRGAWGSRSLGLVCAPASRLPRP